MSTPVDIDIMNRLVFTLRQVPEFRVVKHDFPVTFNQLDSELPHVDVWDAEERFDLEQATDFYFNEAVVMVAVTYSYMPGSDTDGMLLRGKQMRALVLMTLVRRGGADWWGGDAADDFLPSPSAGPNCTIAPVVDESSYENRACAVMRFLLRYNCPADNFDAVG